MGISNPEIQKKVFGPRWEHEIEKQGWPFWKGSCTDCRTVLYASPNHKLENFNERYRLISAVMIRNAVTDSFQTKTLVKLNRVRARHKLRRTCRSSDCSEYS